MSRKRPRSEPEKCKAELNINTKSANLTTFEERLLNSRPQDLTDEQKYVFFFTKFALGRKAIYFSPL